MRTLVNRVSALGTATVVLVGLSLAAIVEQAMFPTAHSSHKRPVASAPGPVRTRSHRAHPSRSVRRVSPMTLLGRQVKKSVAAQRGPVARREYGVGEVPAPVIRVSRTDRGHTWAFGTEAIPAPASSSAAPESSLFLARADGPRWKVALAGTPEFAALAPKAPASVLHANERETLTRFRATPVADTGLMLPWSVGQSWSAVTTGPGAWGFEGGDGRVLAAGDGLLYRMCSSAPGHGLVLLVHPNGLATEYDQLEDVTQVADGDAVKQGDYLGRTGTEQPCGGGRAPRRLVRFALRSATGPLALDEVAIGGWVLHTTSDDDFADRGGLRVEAGNPLLNFGPAPTPTPSPSPSRTPETPQADPKAVT